MAYYHFVGAAGIGMSALAQIMRAHGDRVSGSDRYFDLGQLPERRMKLEAQGIRIFKQDGSGVTRGVTHLINSSAIETGNPDLERARDLGVVPMHRSNLLASIFHGCNTGVAVTGSFGKTSITAMIGWGLVSAGMDPTLVNGGIMRNFETETVVGNAVAGNGTVACIEADESDGTCTRYKPNIGVVTGLARDHKELDELHGIYSSFSANTTDALVLSMQASASLFGMPGPRRVTFGLREGDVHARQVRYSRREVRFSVGASRFRMRQIGEYSIFNALATITVLRELGVSDDRIESGLRSFEGTARHMELVGGGRGIRVFDDFAHNPSKIEAALDAVRRAGAKRILAVFQPHGFGPARFMRQDLVELFARALGDEDRLFMLPIYYVGGTTKKDISSAMIAREAAELGAPVEAVRTRKALAKRILAEVRDNDTILVMGARDDSLRDLCRDIASQIDTLKGPVS